jgi:ribosomal protein S18 acetylase RimI-like enzyme
MNLGTEFVELNKVVHDRAGFDCGEKELNLFLQTQASRHMRVGISKTMILANATTPIDNKSSVDNKYPVCAFYTIAPGSIKRESLPAKLAKKLPYYPVPVFLIAQLAVNQDHQGKGLGKITLIKALEYLWEINSQMAAYAIVVDCLNDNVKNFYKKYGFKILCNYNSKSRMYIPMKVIGKLFA